MSYNPSKQEEMYRIKGRKHGVRAQPGNGCHSGNLFHLHLHLLVLGLRFIIVSIKIGFVVTVIVVIVVL